MRTRSLPLFLAAVLAPSSPGAAAPAPAVTAATVADLHYPELPPPRIPRPERVVLGNGLVLMLLPDHELPLVEGMVLVKAGGRLDPPDKVGLTGLTAAVMRTGGTKTMTGDQVDDRLEGLGARFELAGGAQQVSGSFSCLARDLDALLGLVAETLREPAFAADRLEVARTQARAGISRRNDNAAQIAPREFAKLVYGKSSVYARHSEYATVDAITRDDLVANHRQRFRPNATLIGLAGDFDPAAARRLVEARFGNWARGPEPERFSGGFENQTPGGVYLVEKADVNQSNVWLGHLGITTDNPDLYAVAVMNEVFSGGFAARLFSNIRTKKGLAYSVSGRIGDDYDHPGAFRVSMSTKSATTVEGLQALRQEIDALRAAPPSAVELKRAKDGLLNSFLFQFDTAAKVLGRRLDYEYFGYPADFLERYPAGVARVTGEDVLRVAKRYIQPDRLVQLVVGKSGDFGTPLSSLGVPVATVDVTIPGAPARPAAK